MRRPHPLATAQLCPPQRLRSTWCSRHLRWRRWQPPRRSARSPAATVIEADRVGFVIGNLVLLAAYTFLGSILAGAYRVSLWPNAPALAVLLLPAAPRAASRHQPPDLGRRPRHKKLVVKTLSRVLTTAHAGQRHPRPRSHLLQPSFKVGRHTFRQRHRSPLQTHRN